MNLIKRDDPRYFTQTSNEPYDRHYYLIHFKNKMPQHVDSWEHVQSIWWNTDGTVSYTHLTLPTNREV